MRDTKRRILLIEHDAALAVTLRGCQFKRLVKQGLIPHVELPNGELRFFLDELDAWVQSHHVPAKEAVR